VSYSLIKKTFTVSFIFCFIFVQIILPVFSSDLNLFAQNHDDSTCQKILDQAQQLYYEGKFTESVNLIKSCLTSEGITKDQRIQAYKILSQVALARGNEDQANEIIRQILKLDPDYLPTIEQEPPKFVELVATVRQQGKVIEKESGENNKIFGLSKWVFYPGAAVVAGVGAYFIINGDDGKKNGDPELAQPPDWPDN